MSWQQSWAPAALLCVGALGVGVNPQRHLPLQQPLQSTVPARIDQYTSRDMKLSEDERQAVGVTSYLYRLYDAQGKPGTAAASLYVGYYANQTEGKSIHSPKNCLPGSGWDVLASRTARLVTATGTAITVNRYVLQKKQQRALVLYWYQGRGRVEASEYAVKWQLLLDTALRRRSDEALVRIIVPITTTEADAFRVGSAMAAQIAPGVRAALPA
ncbi:MAG TPA: EpsI family protein [Longimicrobiales bacterium]